MFPLLPLPYRCEETFPLTGPYMCIYAAFIDSLDNSYTALIAFRLMHSYYYLYYFYFVECCNVWIYRQPL